MCDEVRGAPKIAREQPQHDEANKEFSAITDTGYLYEMTYIVKPKNKKQEKALEAILNELAIDYYTEEMEDTAILNAMEKGKRSQLLTLEEKTKFLTKLRSAK